MGAAAMVLAVFSLFFSFSSLAHQFDPAGEFVQTVHGRLDFPEVEMIARNHDVGLYRGGDLSLAPWAQVSEASFIGIDRQGHLLQIIKIPAREQMPERTVAFTLSGAIHIKDFFFAHPGILVAIDQQGGLYRFDWEPWYQSNLRKIVKRAGLIVAGTTCLSAATTAVLSCYLGVSPFSFPMLAEFFGMSISTAMIQAFFSTVHYEADNQLTNGLLPLGLKVENYRVAEFVRDSSGRVVDYHLKFRGGVSSLRRMLEQVPQSFGAQEFALRCEHHLLARGRNPVEYEAKL